MGAVVSRGMVGFEVTTTDAAATALVLEAEVVSDLTNEALEKNTDDGTTQAGSFSLGGSNF
jgi:hypothetical protein